MNQSLIHCYALQFTNRIRVQQNLISTRSSRTNRSSQLSSSCAIHSSTTSWRCRATLSSFRPQDANDTGIVHLLPHHLRGGIGTPARAKTQIASLFTAPIASIAMTANGTLSKNSNSNNNHHNHHNHIHNHNHNKTRTRHISSTPPTYSPYHRERGFHENITQRLLATEIGALNQASLLELRTAISSWYSQAAANPNDTQAFYQAKALLHRILQEVEYSFQQHDKSDITGNITGNITGDISRSNHKIPKSDLEVDKMLDITTINFVLDSWRLINNHKSMQVKNNKREMTDEETIFVNDGLKVLNRICKVAQKYEHDTSHDTIHDTIHDNDNEGLITHPDVKSFNLILDGLSKFGMVDQAKALFQQMQNLAQHRNQAQCRPQIISYNSLLSAYANSKTNQVECAQQASDLLDEMLNVYNQTRNPDIKPDKYSFAIVISAYANAASMSSDAPYQAENILKTMIELCNSSLIQNGGDGEWADLKPDHIHYTSLISAWSNSGLSEAVDRAAGIVSSMQTVISGNNEDVENISTVMSTFSDGRDGLKVEGLIDKMLSIYESDGDESMMPTTMTFTALIDCLSESAAQKVGGDDGAAAIRSENILKKMEELYEAGHAQLKPTVPVYNVLIKAWAKSMRSDAGIKAEALMEKMKDLDESGGYDLKPDVVTFSSTILAYANANDGINAERIFMQMYQVYQDGDADCLPNAIVCSAVINAYGNEGKPNEAERVLDMMNNMDGINVEVDEYCLNCVLKAYLNSTERNNIHKAIEFLSKMDSDGTSSSISYNSVLDQLSKIGQKWAEEKGVHLLENMWNLYHEGNNKVKPDSITYNSLINLLAKSRNPYTAKKAIYYFKDLQRQYNESGDPKLMPVRVTYNATLSAFTALKPNEKDIQEAEALVNEMKDLHSRGHVNVKPDAFTMTSLISCYANSNVENAGERAEELLQDMQELFDNGNESMRPTTASFGAVLNAWARQGNAIRAQAIVDHMETLKDTYNEMSANNVIYNTLINSWAKYGTKESGEKAEEILEKMKDMYEQGNKEVKPTRISYNSVIAAHHKCGNKDAIGKAKRILQYMEESKDSSIEPDVVTYTTFLNIVSRWNNPQKLDIAEEILRKMKIRNLQPNNYTYDAILRICFNTNYRDVGVRRRAFTLAVKIFNTMQTSPQIIPTSYSYSLFFSSLSKFSRGDEQKRLLKRILKDCCEAGLLTEQLLKKDLTYFDLDYVQSLLDLSSSQDIRKVSLRDLPQEWSRNSRTKLPTTSSQRQGERTKHHTGRRKI